MNERIFLSPPHMGEAELELVKQAFSSNYIAPVGPMVNRFEDMFREYTGIEYCLALSSGTGAMHLAIRYLLSQRNSKTSKKKPVVIASTLTFIGSVSPAIFEHCDIVFVDCDFKTWNMDPVLLEQAINQCLASDEDILAVVPTDIYGQCCDIVEIQRICRNYHLPLICDSAEAVGAWYFSKDSETGEERQKHAGSGADAAVFSFNGNKIITTSGGGMLASSNPDLINYAKKLSTQARDNAPYYQHSEIGYNYRLSNILAAIGCGQMLVLNERVMKRKAIYKWYLENLSDLPGIQFMPVSAHNRPTNWLTCLTVNEELFGCSSRLIWEKLEGHNIEARPVWKPMHLQPVFEGFRVIGGDVSESLFRSGLCLPSGSAMSRADIDRISGIIRDLGPNYPEIQK